jgi:tRNA A37 methylthiotransferase MiaB
LAPEAGIRSNFIVGFPGESDAEFQELIDFIAESRLDAIGVFPYSDEDGTEALTLEGKIPEALIQERYGAATSLAESVVNDQASARQGEEVVVLIESVEGDVVEGRAAHQGPEVDGSTYLSLESTEIRDFHVGQYIRAHVLGSDGADLIAQPLSLVEESLQREGLN